MRKFLVNNEVVVREDAEKTVVASKGGGERVVFIEKENVKTVRFDQIEGFRIPEADRLVVVEQVGFEVF